MAERTPGPWIAEGWCVLSDTKVIAECLRTPEWTARPDASRANAAYIVEACNAYPDLLKQRDALIGALEHAVDVAEEARKEWDAAPQGMRAGKLLIALGGNLPGYRADIDAIHSALARAKGQSCMSAAPSTPVSIREREQRENAPYIEQAKRERRNVTFIAEDGCEVTVTPNGHVYFNMADWY